MNQQLAKQNLRTVSEMMEKSKATIAQALPRHLTPERVMRVALTELRTNQRLLECEPASLMGAIVKSAQLGLEVGSALGQAYLVPYGREATLVVGYRGFIALARRSGEIQSITARVVHSEDVFELEYGLDEKLRHIPSTAEDPGPITHVYAVARLKDGGIQYEVMTVGEIEAIRRRSRAANNGPWITDYAEMCRKTVVRRLFKYLPVSIELEDAMLADQEHETINVTPGAADVAVDALNAALSAPQDEPAHEPQRPRKAPEEPQEARSHDARGVPYNPRFHSGSRAMNSDGTWRLIRGCDTDALKRWEESLHEAERVPEPEPGLYGDPVDETGAPEPVSDPDEFDPGFDYPWFVEQINKAKSLDDLAELRATFVDRAEDGAFDDLSKGMLVRKFDARERELQGGTS